MQDLSETTKNVQAVLADESPYRTAMATARQGVAAMEELIRVGEGDALDLLVFTPELFGTLLLFQLGPVGDLTSEDKRRALTWAEELTPDYAQKLYKMAVFATKVA